MENDFLRIACNSRSLRAQLRQLSFDVVEKITTNIINVRAELYAEHEKQEQERQAKQEKIDGVRKNFLEALARDGLTIEDLGLVPDGLEVQSVKKEPRPARVRTPKYRWIEDGETKTWSGQGRTPVFLREYAEKNNGDLSQFLIQK